MTRQDYLNRITELTSAIAELPKGYISQKPSAVRSISIISGPKAVQRKAAI